jgi:hypothetical protein
VRSVLRALSLLAEIGLKKVNAMKARTATAAAVLAMAAAGLLTACESTTAGSALPVLMATPDTPGTTTTVVQAPQTIYLQPPTYALPADTPEGRTVTIYYNALDHGDFATAWNLGGKNLANQGGYAGYIRGFAATVSDLVTISGADGGKVDVVLSALQTDGSIRVFTGTYTVADGVIVGSHMTRTG